MSKIIPLTKGFSTIVDDGDYEWLAQWKWHYLKIGYAYRTVGSGASKAGVLMHRLIAETPPGLYTDHINGDKLDNRRCNLRVCSQSQNAMNAARSKANKTGVKGVYFVAMTGRFIAQLQVEGKQKYLGSFLKLKDAAVAYAKAALELRGEFARLT